MTEKQLCVKYLRPGLTKLVRPNRGDVGIDLYAAEKVFIPVGKAELVPTGISVSLPPGYFIQLRDRSSKSKNYHVMAGVIDNQYRGEIKCRILCHTPEDWQLTGHYEGSLYYEIKEGEKIAQMVIEHDLSSEFDIVETEQLSDTARGANGFGSSGS